MRIVAISILGPNDSFIFRRIHQRWPLQAVLQPDWSQGVQGPSRWRKLFQSPAASVLGRLNRIYETRRGRRRDRRLAELLEDQSGGAAFDAPRHSVPVKEMNGAATARLISDLAPDLIVTSTCPLLKPLIFRTPRLATLNVHWGIAPQYRGESTLFWALYYGDYDYIGVTIHEIDEGIDTGPILTQGFPSLAPADTETSLTAKCALLAADLLEEAIEKIERTGSVDGRIASSKGRLCRRRDRTIKHDIAYSLMRRMGKRSPPSRPPHPNGHLGRIAVLPITS